MAMISRRLTSLGAFLFILSLGAVTRTAAADGARRLVMLVTIDGLAASYLAAPEASLPTLRKLAAEGAVAEGLRVSNPSITWPNHTTLVTGVHPDKHAVLFNGILSRSGNGRSVTIDGAQDQTNLVKVPTVFDVVHAAGLRTAGINWPCTRRSATLNDNFPDVPGALSHTTPRLRAELIRAGILASANDAAFRARGATAADEVWTAATIHLLRSRPPALLLLHLLITDTIQHRHGPHGDAAYAAAALADAQLARIIEALETVGLRDRTTIFVASDHGFALPTKLVHPNIVFRKAGLFRPAPNRHAQSVSEGGTAFVYLTHPATQAEDRAKVIALLKAQEGIAEIVEPAGFAKLHLPDPALNPQTGDLLLVAQDGYAFGNDWVDDEVITELNSAAGSHGYLASNPEMNGVFIAWGRGIRSGVKLALVDNRDVAPTIAALFHLKLPGADGQVLHMILND